MHFDDTTDTLCLTCESVKDASALGDLTGVDACEGQRAVFVIHDLECKCTEWLLSINDREFTRFNTFSIYFRLSRHFSWARKIIDDAVEDVLHTLVLKRRTTECGEEVQCDGALADACFDDRHLWLITFEVSFHCVVVLLNSSFDQRSAVFFDLVDHVRRHVLDFVCHWVTGVVPYPCLTCEEVNHTREIALDADWKYHDEWLSAENVFHLVNDLVVVSADTVELVDVNQTSDLRIIGVAPVGFGLRLNTTRTTENTDAAVEHL